MHHRAPSAILPVETDLTADGVDEQGILVRHIFLLSYMIVWAFVRQQPSGASELQ